MTHHDATMRTTVTLDPDVEQLLKSAIRRSGRSFKEVLNRAIREGLAAQSAPPPGARFRVRAHKMGLRRGMDAGAMNRLLDEIETEGFLDSQGRRS